MDMVTSDYHIYRCMQLDSGNLRSSKLHHVVNVMDMIILYR